MRIVDAAHKQRLDKSHLLNGLRKLFKRLIIKDCSRLIAGSSAALCFVPLNKSNTGIFLAPLRDLICRPHALVQAAYASTVSIIHQTMKKIKPRRIVFSLIICLYTRYFVSRVSRTDEKMRCVFQRPKMQIIPCFFRYTGKFCLQKYPLCVKMQVMEMQSKGFLPVTRDEMRERGIEEFDFIYVSGDAYVDHPSFGPAIICRLLERHGYSVGIIAQPDWHGTNDFMRFGRPRLAFLVSAGNMDSMVNHYTAAKKRRSTDSYSEGGKAGRRPDRAVIVYCNRIREAYGSVPIVIGGIEASLRRFAH